MQRVKIVIKCQDCGFKFDVYTLKPKLTIEQKKFCDKCLYIRRCKYVRKSMPVLQ